ncbi:MAG: tRNA (adenosine(37)-N6)-threonylcarbamoyltransferase complex dimerization subunit type 1 TsaB [Elusimicrobiota bacterium]
METKTVTRPPRRWAILGLDTTGSRLKIALMTPDGKFKSLVRKELNQETLLFPFIDRLINSSGLKLTDISKICAIRGPGRFTGIRIGLTFARMMNALTGIKVVGLTAFEVLAYQAVNSPDFKLWQSQIHLESGKGGLIAVLLHAFKTEYYCQIYKWSRGNHSMVLRPPSKGLATGGKHTSVSTYHWSGCLEGVTGGGNNRTLLEAVEEPKWMSSDGIRKYMDGFKSRLYCIANAEESPDIYSLAPLNSKKAPPGISKILPENIIIAGRLLDWGRSPFRESPLPLYLKPAKYELKTYDYKTCNKTGYNPTCRE